MGIGMAVLLGLALIGLVVGLFSMITNPRDIDAEEEATVVEEVEKKKRRWWRR